MAGARTEAAKGRGNTAQSKGVPGKECQKGEKNKDKKNLQGVGRKGGWGGNGRSGPWKKKSTSRTRNVELGSGDFGMCHSFNIHIIFHRLPRYNDTTTTHSSTPFSVLPLSGPLASAVCAPAFVSLFLFCFYIFLYSLSLSKRHEHPSVFVNTLNPYTC